MLNCLLFHKEGHLQAIFLDISALTAFIWPAYNEAAAAEAMPAPHVPSQVTWFTGTTPGGNCAMYRIKTFNKISPVGLEKFNSELYTVSDSVTEE